MKRWPDGCHDTDSCERHRVCMYHQCVHTGKGAALGGEIDAAIQALIDTPASEAPDPRDAEIERGTVEMPLSDANNLDAVVHALGIEDSDATPAEAVAELHSEIERLRTGAAR